MRSPVLELVSIKYIAPIYLKNFPAYYALTSL